jgi:hypothetical protein
VAQVVNVVVAMTTALVTGAESPLVVHRLKS